MSGLEVVHADLEALKSAHAAGPAYGFGLREQAVEDWMRRFGLTRRQVCDVVSAWLVFGFAAGRLSYAFADLIANDLHGIAQAEAPTGAYDLLDFHTPLSWETYLAFDAGEFTVDPAFDPVEGNTRPLVADILERIDQLAEYPPALSGLTVDGPA